jgi:hypothetical protein
VDAPNDCSSVLVLSAASSTASVRRLRMRMLLFSTLRASGRVSSTILVARFIRSPRIGDRMSSSL